MQHAVGPAPVLAPGLAPAVTPALLLAPVPTLDAAALHLRRVDIAPEPAPAAHWEQTTATDPAKLPSWQLSSRVSSKAQPALGQQPAEARVPEWTTRAEFAFLGTAAAAIALFIAGVLCCWTHCCASCCRQGPAWSNNPKLPRRLLCAFAV